MDFLDLQDSVFTYFAENHFSEDIEKAKLDFIKLSGPFDEEDELLEEKMTHFREWFIFDYKRDGETLVNKFKKEQFTKLKIPMGYLEAFQTSQKSIFTFIKVKNNEVYVKCLFSGEKKIIQNSPLLVGVEKGTYIQARIFKFEESLCLGQSVITHPDQAKKYIDKKIKLLKKEMKKSDGSDFLKQDFLKELFSMRYHLLKYKQLEVSQIYSDTSPVKELANKMV